MPPIPAIRRQIGRNDVYIITCADGSLLLLDFATVEFGDRLFDSLDGTILVYRLDVHGDDLAGIHVQKVFQKLVAEVGRRNGQETHCTIDAAHLERAAVFEGESGRRDSIFD